MQVPEIIDAAAKVAGSQNRLAELVGVTSGNLSTYRTGRKACPLPLLVRLAEIAGQDAREVLYREVMRRAGRPLAIGALMLASALCGFGSSAAGGADTARFSGGRRAR